MNINSKIETLLGESISTLKKVSGGCIAESQIIKTEAGESYFLKTHGGNSDMFLKEAHGLVELSKSNCFRIPKVILTDGDFLLLENIEQGRKDKNFFNEFGKAFAKMHHHRNENFGFFEDNYIGATPQYNIAIASEKTNWAEFYFQKRLMPQLKIAEQKKLATPDLVKGIMKIENRLNEILSGSNELPSLLHGDLWGGNYLCSRSGEVVLIDPAVYYGHREADLAMTKMFGGFSPEFYQSYQNEYPLPEGWEYRQNIYLLYHALNHLNLFGFGYYSQCMQLLRAYI